MKFEGIKKFINVPMLGFCLFSGRFIITGFDVSSAVACFAFTGLYCFNLWIEHIKKPDVSKQLTEKIQQLESQIGAIKLSNGIKTVGYDEKRKF